MLLANPSALALTIRQQNENFNQSEVAQKHSEYLNQLDADLLQSIKNGNYGIMQGFIKDNNLLKKVFKWMELMEVEGRYFMIHKSPLSLEQRLRTDKAYNFHMGQVEKLPEF